MILDIAQEYIERASTLPLAALQFAKDLMRGDPAKFKAGYSADNALIATDEAFGGLGADVLQTVAKYIGASPAQVARIEAAALGLGGEEFGRYVEDAVEAADAAALAAEVPEP